jgi:WD40 repeat protein
VSIWDVGAQATPRTIPRSIEGKLEGRVLAIAFEPHGHRLALGTDYGVELWDLSTDRKELRFLDALGKAEWSFSEIAVSGNAHWLAIGSGLRDSIWDLSIGQPVQYLGGLGVTFTPDSRSVAIASGYRDEDAEKPVSAPHVLLSDVASGSVRRLEGGDGILKVAISRDGHRFAAANADHSITIWDATTGQMLRIIPADENRLGMALSPNGRWLATATGGFMSPLTLWDVETGLPKQTLNEVREPGTNLAFSPDSRLVAFGDDRTVKLWNIETQEQVLLPGKTTRRVNAECFSPDGRWLAAVGGDDVKLWDVSTLQEVRTFVGHTADVLAVDFCPDSSCLVTAGWDGTSRIWNRESGELLATLVQSLEHRRWLVLTPDGLFDGSSDAWRQVLWRFDNDTFNVVPVEAFFNEFYHPGLLADIMSGKRPKPTTSITGKDRRQPRIKLTLDASPTAAKKSPSQPAVRIDVAEASADKTYTKGSGVRDLRLFRNGSLVKMWHGPITLDRSGHAVLSAQPTIVAGENELTAYAFNNDNIKSEDATMKLAGPESLARKGTAYVLAVGINRYANSTFNLNYAVADADDFAQTVAAFQASLASYGDIRIIPIIDAEATKANILSALTRLAGKTKGELRPDEPRAFEQIQATRPGDTVFIYYAGHGAAPEKGKRFYLIAHDYAGGGAGAEAIAGTVNDRELEAAIEEIDASQIILVIDACQSGKTLESDDPRQGPMNSQGLAQLAYEKGMYILAAAQGDEAAKELSQFGHGLLTYALVEEGLRQAKADDNPKDGKILIREWLDYATQRVPKLQLEGMQRLVALGRDVPIVEGERGKALQDRPQRPVAFYRRETEQQPIIIARH